ATTQGFVKLNDCKPAPGLNVREHVLCWIELLLGFEDLVIARFAFLVAVSGDCHGLTTGVNRLGLLCAFLAKSAVRYQGVGNLAEGAESCILVLKLRFLPGGLGLTVAPGQTSTGE